MCKNNPQEPFEYLVEDDAARYLASLTPEERKPAEPGLCGLVECGPSFTPEERAAAWKAIFPEK